jgi:uncharacterized RDD family membrane protein YckC
MATTPARIVAYVIDNVFVGIAIVGVFTLIDRLLRIQALALPLPRLGVYAAIDALYFVALWTGGRRTLGMRWLGIRVLRADDAVRVTVTAAVLRWTVLAVLGLVLDLALSLRPDLVPYVIAPFLGPGWTLLLLVTVVASGTRQGLHDRVAGTAVVASDAFGNAAVPVR